MDIPLDPTIPDSEKAYLIHLDDSTTVTILLDDMPSLIPSPPSTIDDDIIDSSLLPAFLQLKSKITYDYEGQYQV